MERATEAEAANLDGCTERERSPLHHSAQLGFGPDAAARALIIAVALILTWHTWAQWGDLQIDCGRELYVPVEILRGKLLYRDVWYQYGPLTPYMQALLLGFFGGHLSVFYWFGIALAIGCALVLYEIGATLEGRAAGLAAALVLLLRGFGPTQFNYALPYTYAASVSLLLSLFCAWFTIAWVLERVSHKLTPAGIFAGAALLCKPEVGAACYAMLAFAIGMESVSRRSLLTFVRGVIECVPGALICFAFYGWFFWKLGTGFVLLENLQAMPGTYFMSTYGARYAAALGMRFVPAELVFLAITSAGAPLGWFLIARGAHLNRDHIGGWPLLAWVAVLFLGVAAARYAASLGDVGYLFSAMMLVFPPGMYFIGCAFFAYALYEFFETGGGRRRALAGAAFAVLALALAIRVLVQVAMGLSAIFYTPPLVLIFVAVVVRCVRAASRGMSDERSRELVNALLTIEVLLLVIVLIPSTNTRTVPLNTSWGKIYLSPGEAGVARQILDFISAQKRFGRQVVILPEMTLMYVFSGTEAPSRWYLFNPGVVAPGQEAKYLAQLGRAAPEYIVLTNESTAVVGVPYFGLDYDRQIYRWIESNYRVIGEFGDFRRKKGAPLAALLYQRQTEPPNSGRSTEGTLSEQPPSAAPAARK